MILGLDKHVAAACFVEIDAAVRQMRDTVVLEAPVVFNAHSFPPPPDAIIFNLENVGGQVSARNWHSREVWDFSRRNVAKWQEAHPDTAHLKKYVPIGYHTSMERFTPLPYEEKDIDVVFCGHLNERREYILQQLRKHGLSVVSIPHGYYGKDRDAVLARSKLALNMLYYEDGVYPALRVAHLVANKVPVLSEVCPEGWEFVPTCDYYDLVDVAFCMARRRREYLDHLAEQTYQSFRFHPLTLPSSV